MCMNYTNPSGNRCKWGYYCTHAHGQQDIRPPVHRRPNTHAHHHNGNNNNTSPAEINTSPTLVKTKAEELNNNIHAPMKINAPNVHLVHSHPMSVIIDNRLPRSIHQDQEADNIMGLKRRLPYDPLKRELQVPEKGERGGEEDEEKGRKSLWRTQAIQHSGAMNENDDASTAITYGMAIGHNHNHNHTRKQNTNVPVRSNTYATDTRLGNKPMSNGAMLNCGDNHRQMSYWQDNPNPGQVLWPEITHTEVGLSGVAVYEEPDFLEHLSRPAVQGGGIGLSNSDTDDDHVDSEENDEFGLYLLNIPWTPSPPLSNSLINQEATTTQQQSLLDLESNKNQMISQKVSKHNLLTDVKKHTCDNCGGMPQSAMEVLMPCDHILCKNCRSSELKCSLCHTNVFRTLIYDYR